MTQWKTYIVCGFKLRSEIPLGAPTAEDDGQPHLTLHRGPLIPMDLTPPLPELRERTWGSFESGRILRYRNAKGHVLEYRFSEDGRNMEIRYSRTDMDHRAVTLGAALAAALSLQGVPVLHGSVVMVGERALMLAGPSGAGKSSVAAALVDLGCPLLADDLAVLETNGRTVNVLPYLPRLKLYREAGSFLGKSGSEWPRIFTPATEDDKRWVQAEELSGGFHSRAAPLGAIYLLLPREGGGERCEVSPLSPTEACIAVMHQYYGFEWLRIPPATDRLRQSIRIAGQAAVRKVRVPDGLDTIRDTARAVLSDARSLTFSGSLDKSTGIAGMSPP